MNAFSSFFALFWQSLRSSWNICRSHKKQMGLIILSDVLFFLILSFVSMFFVGPIFEHLYAIGELFSGTIPSEENIAASLSNFSEEAFALHYTAVIKYVMLLLFVVFVLWIIFQGFVWKKSYALVGKSKLSLGEFYKRFTLLHIVWAVIFLVLFSLSVKFSLKNLFGGLALLTEQQVIIVILLAHLLFCYLYFVSLLLVEKYGGIRLLKMIFVEAVKKFKYLFAAYVGVLFDLAILFWIFYQLSQAFMGSWVASLSALIGFLVVMLYLSYVRIFLIDLYH